MFICDIGQHAALAHECSDMSHVALISASSLAKHVHSALVRCVYKKSVECGNCQQPPGGCPSHRRSLTYRQVGQAVETAKCWSKFVYRAVLMFTRCNLIHNDEACMGQTLQGLSYAVTRTHRYSQHVCKSRAMQESAAACIPGHPGMHALLLASGGCGTRNIAVHVAVHHATYNLAWCL